MRKVSIIALSVVVAGMVGCSSGPQRDPGKIYMPDMAYSRALETYSSTEALQEQGINYTRKPVAGTIKRGEAYPFPYAQDTPGEETNYKASMSVPNPLPPLTNDQRVEAERLYLIHCGICHGSNLDGNGPLYKGANGPYAAAPRNLLADEIVVNMPAGQMFYSITYGKGMMGPYGPQLTTTQRWMLVHYIKDKQAEAKK